MTARSARIHSSPRILCTNDDGIHAPGLKTLEKIARKLSSDVWTVAPEFEQSGASHSLTLVVPLRLRKINRRKYAVQGTPTDAVMMAVRHIMIDHPPDLILSGVNRGGNVADDVTYSGTVAAAMEGCALGIPSIALSQIYGLAGRKHVKWTTAEQHGPELIGRLLEIGWPKDVLMNINFPDMPPEAVKKVVVTTQGARDQSNILIDARVDARENEYFWLGYVRRKSNPTAGTDLRAAYEGYISVTPLHMDLTHRRTWKMLQMSLSDYMPASAKRMRARKVHGRRKEKSSPHGGE
jgi:5'-nucleotidase